MSPTSEGLTAQFGRDYLVSRKGRYERVGIATRGITALALWVGSASIGKRSHWRFFSGA